MEGLGTLTFLDAWQFIQSGGLPALLFLILIGSMRGWFVWSREHEELAKRLTQAEQERDQWRSAFMRVAGVAESVTSLVPPQVLGGGPR